MCLNLTSFYPSSISDQYLQKLSFRYVKEKKSPLQARFTKKFGKRNEFLYVCKGRKITYPPGTSERFCFFFTFKMMASLFTLLGFFLAIEFN